MNCKKKKEKKRKKKGRRKERKNELQKEDVLDIKKAGAVTQRKVVF
jgi:hypothetical protein